MIDNELKAQVLFDIMKAMMERDGDRIRPQEAEIEMQHSEPAPAEAMPGAPDADDMSPEDHDILEKLLGEHKPEGAEEEDTDEDEEEPKR